MAYSTQYRLAAAMALVDALRNHGVYSTQYAEAAHRAVPLPPVQLLRTHFTPEDIEVLEAERARAEALEHYGYDSVPHKTARLRLLAVAGVGTKKNAADAPPYFDGITGRFYGAEAQELAGFFERLMHPPATTPPLPLRQERAAAPPKVGRPEEQAIVNAIIEYGADSPEYFAARAKFYSDKAAAAAATRPAERKKAQD